MMSNEGDRYLWLTDSSKNIFAAFIWCSAGGVSVKFPVNKKQEQLNIEYLLGYSDETKQLSRWSSYFNKIIIKVTPSYRSNSYNILPIKR